MARSVDNISEREAAPSRRRIRATQRWRRRADHPLNDPFTTRARRAAVRSAEAMLAELSARGYDTPNVQPR